MSPSSADTLDGGFAGWNWEILLPGSRRFQAQEERGSLWAMEKTWLRVSMTTLGGGGAALARLEGGRDRGGSKEMGRLWG